MNRQRYPVPVIPITRPSAAERKHKSRYSVDVSQGQVQCPYMVAVGDSKRACALRKGHPGMHCHAYDIPSPSAGWSE